MTENSYIVTESDMKENKKHCVMILLAGGRGKRMGTDVPKQFIELNGKPILWYSLNAAEKSAVIDECVLVVHPDDAAYVQNELIEKYSFNKVKYIAGAGRERFESVWSGLLKLAGKDWMSLTDTDRESILADESLSNSLGTDIIFIHDGARPFVNEEIITNCYNGANEYGACVAAVRSKDTVKIVDEDGKIISTPDRNTVWNMQTPQTFEAKLIFDSYRKVMASENICITDDAQAVELMGGREVHVVEGSYTNIKVTTPEDLVTAKSFMDS